MDRRGIYVTLTEAGRQRHAEAAPTHRDVLVGVLAGPVLASPVLAGPVLASPVLASPVLAPDPAGSGRDA
jgi:hypothetical protein